MRPWQKVTVVACAALASAAALGAGLRSGGTADQAMTLVAGQQTTSGYAFTVRAAPVDGLYPGADRRLVLTMTNPYDFDLVVTDVRAALVATTKPGCAPVPANLTVGAYAGDLPVRIGAGDDRMTGTFGLRMPNTVADACQQAVFSLTVHADAARDSR